MSKRVAKRDDGNHGHDEGRHRWAMPKDATSLGGLGDPVIPGNVFHRYPRIPKIWWDIGPSYDNLNDTSNH